MQQEIERLNQLLKRKQDENTEYENRLRAQDVEINEFKRRMRDFEQVNLKLSEYENRIALLSQ